MKRLFCVALALLILLLPGCGNDADAQIVATTLPVYEFTQRLCQGTGLSVTRLINQDISCLHDYTMTVAQMRSVESAQVTVISGAGLEDFLHGVINGEVIDASQSLSLIEGAHDHAHDGHLHAEDPHIWLSPENAKVMASNICQGLKAKFPDHNALFDENLTALTADLDALQQYGENALRDLSCRELVTFHDGFTYLAESFDLTILKAVEEESGSEASASALIALATLVKSHELPAIFTEVNGSTAAAGVISAETGAQIFALDMAISGNSYFDAMRHNIDTLKEALQ